MVFKFNRILEKCGALSYSGSSFNKIKGKGRASQLDIQLHFVKSKDYNTK